ncbi:MAG: hypothetical protein AAFN74_21050, partial [Myxococcota bacterium]
MTISISEQAPARSVSAHNASSSLEHQVLDATTDLDYLIHSEGLYDLPASTHHAYRDRFVRDALEHHLNACPSYRSFYSRRLKDKDPKSIELHEIPVIPTSVFKREKVLSVAEDAIQKWCFSSGTQGARTLLGRDRVTLERLLGSIRSGLELATPWEEHEVDLVHLGPDRDEAGDVWFMYVMSLTELIFPTQHYVRQGKFKAKAAAQRIQSLIERDEADIGIITTPFQLLNLLEYLEDRDIQIRGGPQLSVFTAGGWKRHTGRMIPRPDFESRVVQRLGLQDRRQIRDIFNQ